MTPLIDGDILLHELGWSGEFIDRDKDIDDPDREVILSFNRVEELLNDKIKLICEEVGATTPPIIFLSDSPWLNDRRNKHLRFLGEDEEEYVPNFRYEVAKSKPYKGTRNNPKPYHFYNILAYLMGNYDCLVAEGGVEADDEMCIYQSYFLGRQQTIICSRDKDLRICPGLHYSWECGLQRSVGPTETDRLGWLEQWNGKTLGYGLAFFYYQMLVGDSADNIPGCPGIGDKRALALLDDCSSEMDYYNCVKSTYKDKLGEDAKEYFLEQSNLLWMIMERGVGYEFPTDTA